MDRQRERPLPKFVGDITDRVAVAYCRSQRNVESSDKMNGMPGINAPERVARFHEAYSAPTRAIVLRILLKQRRSYTELFDLIPEDVMSRNSVHEALKDLGRLGYVEDDAADGLKRRPPKTTFWANRELIAEDLGATVAYLLG